MSSESCHVAGVMSGETYHVTGVMPGESCRTTCESCHVAGVMSGETYHVTGVMPGESCRTTCESCHVAGVMSGECCREPASCQLTGEGSGDSYQISRLVRQVTSDMCQARKVNTKKSFGTISVQSWL